MSCQHGGWHKLESSQLKKSVATLACMTDTATVTRLPVATVPTPLLPGAVVTLALDITSGESAAHLSAAVRAGASADGRIVLHVDGSDVAVTARVPDIGKMPTGEPVAIVRIDGRATISAVHASERGRRTPTSSSSAIRARHPSRGDCS